MQVVIAVHQDASGVVLSALAGAREGQPKDAVRTAGPAVVFAHRALSQEPDVHGVAPKGAVSTGLDAREAVFRRLIARASVFHGLLAVRTLSFRCSFSEKKDFEESGKSWR